MGRVAHFEIHATDVARAAKFYQAVFGWKVTKWDGPIEYWLVSTGEGAGIDGAILASQAGPPADDAPPKGYVCTIPVESINMAIAAIEGANGKIVVPKFDVPGIGTLAYAHDTENNVFGILQPV
jgi:predicted enzyme related to lactoylglutathione lyase